MFHLSLPVTDLKACEEFYQEAFGATVEPLHVGVSNIHVFEAQLTLHERTASALTDDARSEFHFGQVVPVTSWRTLHSRLVEAGIPLIRCTLPCEGRRGKLVVQDPSGNLLEINSLADRGLSSRAGGLLSEPSPGPSSLPRCAPEQAH